MGKNKTSIPESIKEVIRLYGKDVVKDIRMSNILNDIASFEEIPAAKLVLRVILKEKYGARLLEVENQAIDSELKICEFSSEISRNYGYQEDIVVFLLKSIAYGLGWTDAIPIYNPDIEDNVDNTKAEANRHRENTIFDLKGELSNLKKEYKKLLESLIVIPAKTSAYYPASAHSQLYLVEGKIRLICDALKTKDYEWCKQEKEKILLSHQKDTSSLKRKAYSKVAAAAAALIIGGSVGTSYVSSLGDMNTFNQTIQKGDGFMSTGSYDQAISTYTDAFNNYDAFNSGSYKEDALSKIEEATDKLVEEGKADNTSLFQAHEAIQSELSLDIPSADRNKFQNKLKIVEDEIAQRVEKGHNTLALNISSNNGKLNEEGKKLLEELLKLSPNDYWLNFIKNKER